MKPPYPGNGTGEPSHQVAWGDEGLVWCILAYVVKRAYPTTLTVDAQGRVLLPRPLRQALGLGPGARLVVLVEEGRLVLTPWERVEEELWAELTDIRESLAEELLRERRLEAREDA